MFTSDKKILTYCNILNVLKNINAIETVINKDKDLLIMLKDIYREDIIDDFTN